MNDGVLEPIGWLNRLRYDSKMECWFVSEPVLFFRTEKIFKHMCIFNVNYQIR